MVRITVYGGAGEIGGNKVLVEDQDTRIFLDFGMSFGRRGMFYEEYLRPRVANGLGDFLEMGLVPNFDGIYRPDLLEIIGKSSDAEPSVNGVAISHAHADHTNYVSFLHPKIKIFTSESSLLMLRAIDEAGKSDIENEIIDYRVRPYEENRKVKPMTRMFETFENKKPFKIKNLEIEPINVDHSIPGAFGFIIYTSAGPVVYTGDFRSHGLHGAKTEEFVERARESKPVAMLCEGTRIDHGKKEESEAKVCKECLETAKMAKNLIVADFNFKDVDRFNTFYSISKETKRMLSVTIKDAFFLKWLSQDKSLNVPCPKDENIVIQIPKRAKFSANEKQFLDYSNTVESDKIGERQNEFIACMNFFNAGEFIDIKPRSSIYIRSMSEAFNEEMLIDKKRLDNWLQHFGFTRYHSHCSGHATGQEIKEVVTTVNPKILIPIHTTKPEAFEGLAGKTIKPVEGQRIEI